MQHQVLLTWVSRHNHPAVLTSVAGEKTGSTATDAPQRREKERAIDDEELHPVPVEVKSSAS